MKSEIISLADLADFTLDPKLKDTSITEEEVQQKIMMLAKDHGEMVETDTMEAGSGVICTDANGNTVLIYPHLGLPSAEQAEADVLGKMPGDSFETMIGDRKVMLTVGKILLNMACPIDDTLAAKSGLENVSTLQQLHDAYLAEMQEKKKQENMRIAIMDMMHFLVDNAEVKLDEAEISAWTMEQARLSYDENMAMGIDLRFTEDGNMLTEEETLEMLAQDMRPAFIETLVQNKICADNGFVPAGEDADNIRFGFVYQLLVKKAEEVLA